MNDGQEYVVVRMWKDGRVRLNMVKYPSMYVVTRVEYVTKESDVTR